jgi:hypothetical protein
MCWACEEQALWWRYQLEVAVAQDVIPEGFEPADFEAFGLPVPGRAQGNADQAAPSAADAASRPSATVSEQSAAPPSSKRATKPSAPPDDAFVCEPADRQ